jgi:hypothetical protein
VLDSHLADANKPFTANAWPTLICGVCNLSPLLPSEIETRESQRSIELREHDGWEPEWISGQFHAYAQCGLQSCRTIALVTGVYSVDGSPNYSRTGAYEAWLSIRHVSPPVSIMPIPDRTPGSVQKFVVSAAELIWISPPAAAGQLRCAVEELLTCKKIPKTRESRGRRLNRTTHERIQLFKQQSPAAAELLEAVKWIGNDGSHVGALNFQAIVDAAQLLGAALTELYDSSFGSARRLAKSVNQRRGAIRTSRTTGK